MSEPQNASPDAPPPSAPAVETLARPKMPVWAVRTIIGAVAAVVLVVGFLIAQATVPLSWANTIKQQVGDQLGNSIPLGMFYGFTFSFAPVLIAWQAHHKKLRGWMRGTLLVLAAVLTIPNLLTLGVLYGTTTSAHNALSIWNTGGANWFGTWSQSFMVVGVVCAVAVIVLGRMWLQRGRKLRALKAAERLLRENNLGPDATTP